MSSAETDDAPSAGETILVVDDNAPNRLLAEAMLETSGYKVLLAEDGVRALEMFRKHKPDLILLDLLMPVMDGFEAFRQLRAMPEAKDTPIVIVTALTDLVNVQRAIDLSPDDFLAKPIKRIELLARVRSLLDGRRPRAGLRAQASAQDRERQREQLSAMIVHDLKHPLSAIYFNAGMLHREPVSRLGAERIERILRACETLNGMITNLLDVNRGEQGGMPLLISEFEASPLVEEVLSSVSGKAEQQRQRVELKLHGGPASVKGDREVLRRVLENLVDNSTKYSPPDSVILLETSADEKFVQFRVRDEGPGIPTELRDRIFQRYGQLERDAHLRGRASRGLGLVFCRMAVEAHQGRIWVEDNVPQGSCFCVELPVGA